MDDNGATAEPIQPVMNVDDAANVVAQVCAAFQGTLQQHQQIQEAVQILVAAAKEPSAVTDG